MFYQCFSSKHFCHTQKDVKVTQIMELGFFFPRMVIALSDQEEKHVSLGREVNKLQTRPSC